MLIFIHNNKKKNNVFNVTYSLFIIIIIVPTYQNLPRVHGVCPKCGADVGRAGGNVWGHLCECVGPSWASNVRGLAAQCSLSSSSSSFSSSSAASFSASCVNRAVCAARARASREARVLAAVLGPRRSRAEEALAQRRRERCRRRRAEILAGMARRAEEEGERASACNGSDSAAQPDVLECFERAKDFKASCEVPAFCLELLRQSGLPEDRVVSEPLTLPLPEDPAAWVGALNAPQKGVVFL